MKYPHVVQALYGYPWAAKPDAWHTAHSVFMRHLGGELPAPATLPAGKRPEKDLFGEPLQQMIVRNGVAIIPVRGVLIKGAGLLEKSCGVVSHEDIHDDLTAAMEQGVRGILLDIDSPGGTVLGTPELAARIAAINRGDVTVRAFTDSLMASAAYYLAAGSAEIYAAPSATVGSVGVIWETYNVVEALKERGIEPTVFTSGPFKGTGHPWTKLSEDQRAWMQSEVDKQAAQFKEHIWSHRDIAEQHLQGQTFTGSEAEQLGLTNGSPHTLAEVLDLF
jgi:signal peptide peptidase SppA